MPLRDGWELKRVPIRSHKKLPRLKPPAGYVCLIRDMDYGSRYKLEPTNDPAAHLDDVRAALPFKTKIAYIAKTNDAKAVERYFHRRYARDEWFDLDDAQLREIRRLTSLGRHDAGDWQRERAFDSEEPLPAAHRMERQPPVSLKDLISNSYQTAAPARRSQAAEEKAAGGNRGWLYFFIGIIAAAVLAAAFGARLTDSRLSDSPGDQTNTARGAGSSARLAASPTHRPTSTKRPTLTSTQRPTATPTLMPTATDTDIPTATDTPTSTHTSAATAQPTAAGATGATMYVTTRDNMSARVRACPGTTCGIIGGLKPGAEIQTLGRVEGEAVNGSDEWIEFRHGGAAAYVHSSLVSPQRPNQ